MIDLMSLEEQVYLDFDTARRRAWLRRLKALLLRKPLRGVLLCFDEARRTLRASGGVERGKRTVELSKIIGSAGKHDQFDERFMPLAKASAARWRRIDRAFRMGCELPPVTLYKLGEVYFVKDGHNRVSVARFHDAGWIDAEVTEFRTPARLAPHAPPEVEDPLPAGRLIGLGIA